MSRSPVETQLDYFTDYVAEFDSESSHSINMNLQLEEAYKIIPKETYILMIETFKMIINNFEHMEVMVFYDILKSFNVKTKTNIFDINTMFNWHNY